MEKKDARMPIPMDVQLKSEGGMAAIHCPSCGAGAAFGQAGCGFCGSGLLRNEKTNIGRFGVPNNSREWKVDVDFSSKDDLRTILKQMEKAKVDGQYSYVIWKGVPAIVGGDIDAKKSLENRDELLKEIRRERLGKKWTKALDEFHGLQVDLGTMDDELRAELPKVYRRSFHPDALIPSDSADFFGEPTFKNFEAFMAIQAPKGDDADDVRYGIQRVRKFITQVSER